VIESPEISSRDALPVDPHAVVAAEVHQPRLALVERQRRVPPRHALIVDAELGLVRPSDQHAPRRRQREVR
jgi:hypothetical protein